MRDMASNSRGISLCSIWQQKSPLPKQGAKELIYYSIPHTVNKSRGRYCESVWAI